MYKCTTSILSSFLPLHLGNIERVLYKNSQSHQNFENLEAIFEEKIYYPSAVKNSTPFSQRNHESRINNARDLTKRSIDIKSIRFPTLIPAKLQPSSSNLSPPIILRFRLQSSVRTLFVRARVATRVSTFYRSLRHAPRLKIIARKRRLRDTVLPSPSLPPLYARRSEFHDRSTC